MRFGVVILPEERWSVASSRWRRTEALGFDHAWTYDHLAWRALRDSPWFGALPTLTAAAAVTSTVRLGTLVATPNFRHPVPFAKELMTLDDISGGRVTVGLGAGAEGWDSEMLGSDPWPPAERAERFAEFVEVLDVVLSDPAASWPGRHYSAVEARSLPGCVQQPRVPFAVAATGPQGMRLAARHGELWVTTGDRRRAEMPTVDEGVAGVAAQLEGLDAACEMEGREPASLGRLVLLGPGLPQGLESVAAFEDTVGRYADLGVTDLVVHWPRPSEPYAGDVARFEEIFTAAP